LEVYAVSDAEFKDVTLCVPLAPIR